MTAPTPSGDEHIVASLRNLTPGFGTEEEAADRIEALSAALAAVTAERDQARQMLADAWDEGVSFGWHSTELRTDENPYRKARS